MAILDVGQGLAVAVLDDAGHSLLYDAGNSRDDAERVVVPFLRSQGVERLTYLVLSHPDQDHIGGIPAVLETMPVDTFVDPVIPSTNRTYAETLRLVLERGIRPLRAERGLVLDFGPSTRIDVLWPARPLLRDESGDVLDNDNCLVLLIEHGGIRLLLPGDLETRGETELVAREGPRLQSALLVVGHHGSRTSSSEPFLTTVRPEVAIISVGAGNRYGHPHRETLQRLRAVGARIYRTDLDGTVVVHVAAGRYSVETEKVTVR